MGKGYCPTTRLKSLHNRHAGGSCVVVANGPSLNNMHLGFLKKQVVIGLNKIYLGFARFQFYPRYYVAINPKVITQSASEIRKLNCVKFLSRDGAKEIIPEDGLTYHLNANDAGDRFYCDIAQGIHEGWTVTYAALQVAYFLGFTKVIIIGMDHRYEYQGKPNEACVMGNKDPNHFCDTYFANLEWDNPDLQKSEESFCVAREKFEADGRQIIDATLDGACEIFEKQDYRSLFQVAH
jgi:hypothetical protein